MILYVDSDAAFQVCEQARSETGNYHYLGTTDDGNLFNAPIEVVATVIKQVIASVAEAEVVALFHNAQVAITL